MEARIIKLHPSHSFSPQTEPETMTDDTPQQWKYQLKEILKRHANEEDFLVRVGTVNGFLLHLAALKKPEKMKELGTEMDRENVLEVLEQFIEMLPQSTRDTFHKLVEWADTLLESEAVNTEIAYEQVTQTVYDLRMLKKELSSQSFASDMASK